MKKSRLNNFVIDRLKSVEENIYDYKKTNNPKNLHHLRVDIKKIKTIYSFARKVHGIKRDALPLQPLFQKAGKIRELEINIQLLHGMPKPPKKWVDRLKTEKEMLILQFHKSSLNYLRSVKAHRKKISFPEKMTDEKALRKYFKKEKRNVDKLVPHLRKKMHGYRKKIKKLIYLYEALPSKLRKKTEWNEKRMEERQKKLGDWHDTYSAIDFISRSRSLKNKSSYISKLKRKEKRQFGSLFNN